MLLSDSTDYSFVVLYREAHLQDPTPPSFAPAGSERATLIVIDRHLRRDVCRLASIHKLPGDMSA